MRREPHLSVEPKFFLEDWPRRAEADGCDTALLVAQRHPRPAPSCQRPRKGLDDATLAPTAVKKAH